MFLNMLLNVIFVLSMLNSDFIAPHVGLALATTASAYFNAAMLAVMLKKDAIIERLGDLSLPLLRILLACCAMSLVIILLSPDIELWSQWRWFERVYQLSILIVPAILCYALMLWIMGFRRDHLAI